MDFRRHIQSLIENRDYDRAYNELSEEISVGPAAWMLTERGKISWRRGNVRAAMNDYHAADRLEPDGDAARLLENAQAIMQFRCTDLLNP